MRARTRETHIWLTPTSAAISDWVISSRNRSSTIRRSRSGRRLEQAAQQLTVLQLAEAEVLPAEFDHRVVARAPAGASIESARWLTRNSRASTTRSTGMPQCSASASIDGESERSAVSSSTARMTFR